MLSVEENSEDSINIFFFRLYPFNELLWNIYITMINYRFFDP